MTPQPAPRPRVVSPCIKVCALDNERVCIGCGRTIDEIMQWPSMTEDQQRQVCELARQRREAAASTKQA